MILFPCYPFVMSLIDCLMCVHHWYQEEPIINLKWCDLLLRHWMGQTLQPAAEDRGSVHKATQLSLYDMEPHFLRISCRLIPSHEMMVIVFTFFSFATVSACDLSWMRVTFWINIDPVQPCLSSLLCLWPWSVQPWQSVQALDLYTNPWSFLPDILTVRSGLTFLPASQAKPISSK